MGLGDTWHKMMVYFGISDDEDDYDEEETLAPPRRARALVSGARSNVRKLSRLGRSRAAEYDEIFADEPAPRAAPSPSCVLRGAAPGAGRGPSRRPQELQRRAADRRQVQGRHPGDPQPAGLDTELSKRLIDFGSGLTYALDGGMQRIADKVFLLTPRNVEVSAEEKRPAHREGLLQPVLARGPR